MMSAPRERGHIAENAALRYLTKQGLSLVERNFRCRQGEIDLIMLAGNTLVFIEVRLRSGNTFGSAAESVTRRKQRRILLASRYFLQQQIKWRNQSCRFDVIAIDGSDHKTINWIRDAFRIDG